MSIDDFARYSTMLHRLTADFARAVPEDQWHFTPAPPGKPGRAAALHRIGDGFAPFCKQLRHVVCARGVYSAALATKSVDWTRRHEHYVGPLTRDALLAALDDKQRQLLAILETVDIDAPIDSSTVPPDLRTSIDRALRLAHGARLPATALVDTCLITSAPRTGQSSMTACSECRRNGPSRSTPSKGRAGVSVLDVRPPGDDGGDHQPPFSIRWPYTLRTASIACQSASLDLFNTRAACYEWTVRASLPRNN